MIQQQKIKSKDYQKFYRTAEEAIGKFENSWKMK